MNEDVNEEWLSDKSRFSCDGLKRQRLTEPMIRDASDGQLRQCTWEEAIVAVAKALDSTHADKIAAVAGGMADAEVRDHTLANVIRCFKNLLILLCSPFWL